MPSAQLALATILQAYAGVSDDEVIEATVMDRLAAGVGVPGCGCAAVCRLVGFRKRLIEQNLDRALVERTVALAARTGEFGVRALRAALDSSPLAATWRCSGCSAWASARPMATSFTGATGSEISRAANQW